MLAYSSNWVSGDLRSIETYLRAQLAFWFRLRRASSARPMVRFLIGECRHVGGMAKMEVMS